MGSRANVEEPGARIADRYVVEARLGAGGMGVVLRAMDERLGRAVAVKVLSAESVGDAAARARLIREARAAARLEHPGIVHVYDVGETADGGAFLVMELVRGRSLRELTAGGPLPIAEGARILVEVAKALGFAHRAGFVHRDMKPDNVMVREDGRPVILDFGLAKRVGSAALAETIDAGALTLTAKGAMVGTPAYLAPEQAQGETLDARVDQFALAVLGYEILTGRLPWRGATAAAVIASLMRDEPIPASSSRKEVPPALDAVLQKALAKDPGGRFADVEELAERFAEAAGLPPSSVAAESLPRPPSSRDEAIAPRPQGSTAAASTIVSNVARPRPGRGRWIALAAVACAIGGALVLRGRTRTEDAARPVTAPARAPASSPLHEDLTSLACPPLEARGVDEPAGWLGAAAAAIVCSRAQVLLQGHAARTLVPAELLGAPGEPREDFPPDLFADPTARSRAIAAAAKRAVLYVDGTVARASAELEVSLVLRLRDGAEYARGWGKGPVLLEAVRAAMEALPRDAIPRVQDDDAFLASYLGVRSVDSALALHDLNVTLLTEDAVASATECARVAARDDLAEEVAFYAKARCAERLYQAPPPPPGFAFESLAAGKMMRTLSGLRVAGRLPATWATEVAGMTARIPDNEARALMESAEAEAREDTRDLEGSRRAALAAVHSSPKATDVFGNAWHRLALASREDAATTAAHVAWVPYEPFAEAYAVAGKSKEARLLGARRAFVLGPHGFWPSRLGSLLLDSGRREEARSVAAQSGAEGLLLDISNSEATFGETLRQAHALFARLPADREGGYRAFMAAPPAVFAALVLGRPFDDADVLVARYVDPEPPLLTTKVVPMEGAVLVCLVAPEKTGRRCIERLKELFDRGFFGNAVGGSPAVFDGALAFVRRDYAGATKAWRTLLRDSSWAMQPIHDVAAVAFERAGDDALAEKLDAAEDGRGARNGADLSSVRSARRAEKAGDTKRARQLAQAVVEAWSVADETVPAVAEMRALLRRAP